MCLVSACAGGRGPRSPLFLPAAPLLRRRPAQAFSVFPPSIVSLEPLTGRGISRKGQQLGLPVFERGQGRSFPALLRTRSRPTGGAWARLCAGAAPSPAGPGRWFPELLRARSVPRLCARAVLALSPPRQGRAGALSADPGPAAVPWHGQRQQGLPHPPPSGAALPPVTSWRFFSISRRHTIAQPGSKLALNSSVTDAGVYPPFFSLC